MEGVVQCILTLSVPAGKELFAELGHRSREDIQEAAPPFQGWAAGRSPATARVSWKGFAHPSAAQRTRQKERSGELSRKAAAEE